MNDRSNNLIHLGRNTPLVELAWIETKNRVRFFAKCEFVGPTGSHKARMYTHMVNSLERQGVIHQEKRLIDFSSGNAGAALSYIGAVKGYKVTVVRPAGLSVTKATQIRSLGADLILTPEDEGVEGAKRVATELANDLGEKAFLMHQTDSSLNIEAFEECGREIVHDLARQDLEIHGFVCGIGTGGTLSGIAKSIKDSFSEALVIGGEVEGADLNLAHLEQRKITVCQHHLEGVSPGMIFSNTHLEFVDALETCSEAEAWKAAFELERHGFLVGPSSGLNVSIAKRIADRLPNDSNLVIVFFDAAWKYYPEREKWLCSLGLQNESDSIHRSHEQLVERSLT